MAETAVLQMLCPKGGARLHALLAGDLPVLEQQVGQHSSKNLSTCLR